MVLQRWDPFNELWRMGGFGLRDAYKGARAWGLPLDVVQDVDSVVVRASLPGVKAEDIEVTVEEGVLTIKAESGAESEQREGDYLMRERGSGRLRRRLRLPDTVDTENAESRHKDGVLTVTFPKLQAKKARRLEIEAA